MVVPAVPGRMWSMCNQTTTRIRDAGHTDPTGVAVRSIQSKDLLQLSDMTEHQMWMASEIANDINLDIEGGNMSMVEAADVLERIAAILRGKSGAQR